MTRWGEAYLCQWARYVEGAEPCNGALHEGTAFCETHLPMMRADFLKAWDSDGGRAMILARQREASPEAETESAA